MSATTGRIKESLNLKQKLFIEAYVANGGNASAASREAGYSSKNSSATGRELLKSTKVQNAIAEIQCEVRTRTEFTLEKALLEAEETWKFAKEKGNAMAMIKATELRCRLAGLLVDLHDVNINQTVDISLALREAEKRVLVYHGQIDSVSPVDKKADGI